MTTKHLEIVAQKCHIKSKLSDEYYSFCVYDKKTKLSYWVDVSRNEYGDITTEWNQYIFFLTDQEDLTRKARQDDIDFFQDVDEVVSQKYEDLTINAK